VLCGAETVPGGQVAWRFTGTGDGDFADGASGPGRRARQEAITAREWVTVHQVHGDGVVVVDDGATSGICGDADAVVSAVRGVPVAVRTADCAPVVLAGPGPVAGVVHAGWRGLMAGVVQRAVAAVLGVGADLPGATGEADPSAVRAVLGSHIGAGCYAFGEADLAQVVGRYGDAVGARTASGAPALDLAAGVDAALADVGVAPARRVGECTACGPQGWWSHRARGDTARLAAVAWVVPGEPGGSRGVGSSHG